jgi:HSP20 family protein
MDRLFEIAFPRIQRHKTTSFPAINVWTKETEGLIVTAELPGFIPDDIDISVTGDTLTVSGKRQPEETLETVQYHRQERTYGEFSRTVQLPYPVNRDKVEATVRKGILQITLPRIEIEKPKQIAVRVGQ